MLSILKRALPNRPVAMRVWRGPFRGARVAMNPRVSLRKALGLYEHELNPWLTRALDRVAAVIDVGANDGYFTFGCAAALRRRGTTASIIAFEGQARHVAELRAAAARQPAGVAIEIVHAMVDRESGPGRVALDDVGVGNRARTLIKIDVEGAEEAVVAGAASWLTADHLFVIEVHAEPSIARLRRTFEARGLPLELISQQSLPILGREVRDADNWWLVSDLGAGER